MAARTPGDLLLSYDEIRLVYNTLAGVPNKSLPAAELLGKLYRAIVVRASQEERAELAARIRAGVNYAGRLCPECGRGLEKIAGQDAYGCPKCGGEWWPADSNEAPMSAAALWQDEQRVKRALIDPNSHGGGKKGGRRQKQKKPPPVPWYQR
ncbi:MAG: hypothetical protein ACM3X6_06450 [Patescibacteria group bacterium]